MKPIRLISLLQHIQSLPSVKSEELSSDVSPYISLLTGGPGAGKTSALNELRNDLLGKNIHAYYCASTNSASNELKGKTVHSFLNIPINEENPDLIIQKIETSFLSAFFNTFQERVFVVIDEAFILNGKLLNMIFEGLLKANKTLINRGYFPIHLVLCGDPAQLLSISEDRFYKSILPSLNVKRFELSGVYRQSNIPHMELWSNSIDRYRRCGEVNGINEWLSKVSNIIHHTIDFNPSLDRFTIAFTNEMVNNINLKMLLHHCELKDVPLYDDRKASLCLAEGAPIIYTSNIKDMGIYKRDRGVINRIVHKDNSLLIHTSNGEFIHEIGMKDIPFSLGWAGTIHMSQGASYEEVQVLMSPHMQRTSGASLVSLTRHRRKLRLVGMSLEHIIKVLISGIDKQALSFLS
jgi:ATP-dependent exoDNAse (exonuclease V) alpha subunit